MSTKPFVVNIGALRRTPGGRQTVSRLGSLDELAVAASRVPAGTDVAVDAVFEVAGKAIVVTGTVSSAWAGECRRCLGPVTGDLKVSVREVYEPPPRPGDEPQAEALDEAETYPLSGDTLDLSPLARDALLLELPLAPLCRDDCAGLCPECGADRNSIRCACALPAANGAWAALDALRKPDST